MIASRVTRDVLEQAAQAVGVRAEITPHSAMWHRVKLYPIVTRDNRRVTTRARLCPVCGEKTRIVGATFAGYIGACGDAAPSYKWANWRRWPDARGDSKYQRESVGYGTAGRRVHAVCWHGFRDYLRAVYKITPDARFHTSLDTWRGSTDFEARFRESGYQNIGPPIAPVAIAEACRCPERGRAHEWRGSGA